MFRLFFRTLLNIFLWIILLVNLFIFFDIPSPITVGGSPLHTFDDTYFGVSGLIDAFKSMPNSSLGDVATKLNNLLGTYSQIMSRVFNFGWSQVTTTATEIIDADDIFTRILYGFKMIGALLAGITSTLGSLIMGLALPILFFAWLLFAVLSLLQWIWSLIGGTFATPLPHSGLLDTSIVNNLLTSLRATI